MKKWIVPIALYALVYTAGLTGGVIIRRVLEAQRQSSNSTLELTECRQREAALQNNLNRAVERGVNLEAKVILFCQQQGKKYPCF